MSPGDGVPTARTAAASLVVLADLDLGGAEPLVPGEVSTRRFEAGEVVVEAGAAGDAAYFVVSGEARARRGTTTLCTLGPGQCFGERAVLDHAPRAATVEACSTLVVLRVAAERFRRWSTQHPPLAGLLGTMQHAYQRPDGGLVTVHRGTHAGAPCVTSVRQLSGGRALVIARLIGEDELSVTLSGAPPGEVEVLEHAGDAGERTLRLQGGRAVGLHVEGRLDGGVEEVTGRMVSGRPLRDAERARFEWTGSTGVVRGGEALLCACVGLTVPQAESMVADGVDVAARCGAGSVCGACTPRLDALRAPRRRGWLAWLTGRGG